MIPSAREHFTVSSNSIMEAPNEGQDNVEYVDDPRDSDILCGREKNTFNHGGNRTFREAVELHLPTYRRLTSRQDRSRLFKTVLEEMQVAGCRFLKFDAIAGLWYVLDSRSVRDKISHAFRDRYPPYNVSRTAKKRRSSASEHPDSSRFPEASILSQTMDSGDPKSILPLRSNALPNTLFSLLACERTAVPCLAKECIRPSRVLSSDAREVDDVGFQSESEDEEDDSFLDEINKLDLCTLERLTSKSTPSSVVAEMVAFASEIA